MVHTFLADVGRATRCGRVGQEGARGEAQVSERMGADPSTVASRDAPLLAARCALALMNAFLLRSFLAASDASAGALNFFLGIRLRKAW